MYTTSFFLPSIRCVFCSLLIDQLTRITCICLYTYMHIFFLHSTNLRNIVSAEKSSSYLCANWKKGENVCSRIYFFKQIRVFFSAHKLCDLFHSYKIDFKLKKSRCHVEVPFHVWRLKKYVLSLAFQRDWFRMTSMVIMMIIMWMEESNLNCTSNSHFWHIPK